MPVTVKNLLDIKGREVFTVTPGSTIGEVAATLAEKSIGAVVVAGVDGRIAGIFTERDLVKIIVKAGMDCLSQPVASAMTNDVQRCREDSSINDLMEMMTTHRFRHVPVEVDGKLAGIVSIGDVVKSRIAEVEMEAEQIKAYIAG